GYTTPGRGSRDHAPAAVLGDLLGNGEASRRYQGLVKGKEMLIQVEGGMNWPLGNAWNFSGPTLLTVFGLYKPTTSAKAVVDAIQEEVQKIARQGVPAADLGRAKTTMRPDFYAGLEPPLYRHDPPASRGREEAPAQGPAPLRRGQAASGAGDRAIQAAERPRRLGGEAAGVPPDGRGARRARRDGRRPAGRGGHHRAPRGHGQGR